MSTGFGALANTVIPAERTAELQLALIRSHAAGMGAEVEREVVRAMMLLRARSLAMGYSGARPEVVETILALLDAGITPVVPEHGSLGASGDLAPLAAVALVLLGEGEARRADGSLVDGATALADATLEPLVLRAKEGLALINGTDGMLGMLVLAIADLDRLLRVADIAAAMSVEALLGTDRAFAEDLIAMRPQLGQAVSAANLRRLLAGSPIVASHRHGDDRVQDAYSLRCTPQVHGAARDTVEHARTIAGRELESCIDNPVVLPDGRVESSGNFHGAPLAAVVRLPRRLDRRRRCDQRRPHRPPARSGAVARPPAVPRPRRRRELGPDARPVQPGGDGGREPPARRAGEHRHAADERDAGGPRLAGLVGDPQAAGRGGEPGPHPRRRARRRLVGSGAAPAAGARGRHGGGRRNGAAVDWRPRTRPMAGTPPGCGRAPGRRRLAASPPLTPPSTSHWPE